MSILANYEIEEVMDKITEAEVQAAKDRENLFETITLKYRFNAIINQAIREIVEQKTEIFVDISNMSTAEFEQINNFIEEDEDRFIKQVLKKALDKFKEPVDALAKALAEAENK